MRFVIDAQLPPGLAARLISLGHQAEHVTQISLQTSDDVEIWRYAIRHGAVIVTKDEDFVSLGRREPSSPPVVWIRLGNTTNRALWRAVEPLLPEILDALSLGEKLIEIR
jgi:predicted nuclease of predicted toxin-antitoxin system